MSLVKHSPGGAVAGSGGRDSTFLVKSSTPFVSAVKRVDKMLQKPRQDEVVIKGMGRAMEKAISVGGVYESKLGYTVEYRTGSIEVLDEIVPEDPEEDDSVYKKRMVSLVEVKIKKKIAHR